MDLQAKIESIFVEFNFKPVLVKEQKRFEYNGHYHFVSFVNALNSFVIESASNLSEAEMKVFEDSDVYPLNLGEKELLRVIREDLIQFYMNE